MNPISPAKFRKSDVLSVFPPSRIPRIAGIAAQNVRRGHKIMPQFRSSRLPRGGSTSLISLKNCRFHGSHAANEAGWDRSICGDCVERSAGCHPRLIPANCIFSGIQPGGARGSLGDCGGPNSISGLVETKFRRFRPPRNCDFATGLSRAFLQDRCRRVNAISHTGWSQFLRCKQRRFRNQSRSKADSHHRPLQSSTHPSVDDEKQRGRRHVPILREDFTRGIQLRFRQL